MLDDIIAKKKRELESLPQGTLILKNGCYYHKDNGIEKGITKNPGLVSALARSRYLQKEIPILEKNRDLAKWYDKNYTPLIPSALVASFPPSYQHLPMHYFMGIPEKDPVSSNPYKPDQLKYQSNGGVLMRSKSEVLIANELEACCISYQYEPRIVIGGKIVYPDFLLEHPWKKDIVIWEHLGLMDNPDYQKRARKKLSFYCMNGFYPFQNFICTFENDIEDRRQIRHIIQLLHLA